MPMFETPIATVFPDTDHTGTGMFTPLTPPLNSAEFKTMMVTLGLMAGSNVELKVGVRSSADAVTWGTAAAFPSGASFSSTSGWGARSSLANPNTVVSENPFYQIGVIGRNTASDGLVRTAQVKVRCEYPDVRQTTLLSPLQPVISPGSSTPANEIFYPLLPALPSVRAYTARVMLELRQLSTTTDLRVRFALQRSNDLEVWDSADVFTVSGLSDYVTSEGVSTITSFVQVNSELTDKYFRVGVLVGNVTGSALEGGNVGLRLDLRASN